LLLLQTKLLPFLCREGYRWDELEADPTGADYVGGGRGPGLRAAVRSQFPRHVRPSEDAGFSGERFEVKIVGVTKSVMTSQGLTVPVQAIGSKAPDCVVVPAIGFKMPGPLEAALGRPEIRDAAVVLRQWARKGALMTAACIGTFIMAESGLLDHQRVTTTWWLVPMFRRRYPKVSLDESQMIVKSGRFVTAGAALSHMDLALWIIRGVSPKLTSLTGNYLIVDSRPTQSAHALTDHLVHSDPLVQRFEDWARTRLKHGFSLDDAARAVASSKRTLARHMDAVLGKSPLSYFQSLRVERRPFAENQRRQCR
jgi:transcriptional regulator GlxA family with amidase domain